MEEVRGTVAAGEQIRSDAGAYLLRDMLRVRRFVTKKN